MRSFSLTFFLLAFLCVGGCFLKTSFDEDDERYGIVRGGQLEGMKLNAILIENKFILIEIKGLEGDGSLPLFTPVQDDNGNAINRMREGEFFVFLNLRNNVNQESKDFIMCSSVVEGKKRGVNNGRVKVDLDDFKLVYGHGDVEFDYSAKMYLLENDNVLCQFILMSGDDERISAKTICSRDNHE